MTKIPEILPGVVGGAFRYTILRGAAVSAFPVFGVPDGSIKRM
jgi:hypothetical protein